MSAEAITPDAANDAPTDGAGFATPAEAAFAAAGMLISGKSARITDAPATETKEEGGNEGEERKTDEEDARPWKRASTVPAKALHEARQEKAAIRAQLEEARAQLAAFRAIHGERPQEQAPPAKPAATGKINPADFETPEAFLEFVTAQAEARAEAKWREAQENAARTAQEQAILQDQEAVVNRFRSTLAEAVKVEPETHDAAVWFAENISPHIHPAVERELLDGDLAPFVIHHLALNPSDLRAVAGDPDPRRALRALGRIEERVAAARNAAETDPGAGQAGVSRTMPGRPAPNAGTTPAAIRPTGPLRGAPVGSANTPPADPRAFFAWKYKQMGVEKPPLIR